MVLAQKAVQEKDGSIKLKQYNWAKRVAGQGTVQLTEGQDTIGYAVLFSYYTDCYCKQHDYPFLPPSLFVFILLTAKQ